MQTAGDARGELTHCFEVGSMQLVHCAHWQQAEGSSEANVPSMYVTPVYQANTHVGHTSITSMQTLADSQLASTAFPHADTSHCLCCLCSQLIEILRIETNCNKWWPDQGTQQYFEDLAGRLSHARPCPDQYLLVGPACRSCKPPGL